MRRILTLLIVAAAALPSCRFGDGVPEPLPTARGERSSSPLQDGRYRFWPHSGPVVPGRVYAFTLYTHCGVDFLVDFDGSFWDLKKRPASGHEPLGNPQDRGTMELVYEDEASYRSLGGTQLLFRRSEGPKDVFLCE